MNKTPNKVEKIDVHFIMQILLKRKFTIIIIASLFAIGISFKIWIAKPIYSGNAFLEIGEVSNIYEIGNNSVSTVIQLDNVNNLKEITKLVMAASNSSAIINITTQNGADNILHISVESINPEEIQSTLTNTIKYILIRHEKKVKLYQNSHSKTSMTKVIGKISVDKEARYAKKLFISVVSFFGGLALGIFLAFLQEFIINKHLSAQNDEKKGVKFFSL